ncbi:MAG: hypothetical protein II008_06195 [Oscillospiraceae bacterium]|nr:hypothetical protein [Oscillospiraceae bacterium]
MKNRRIRFVTWCNRDVDDNTKIIYTFRMVNGDGTQEVKHFTSDDEVPYSMLGRIQQAWIESIDLTAEGWNVTIYED